MKNRNFDKAVVAYSKCPEGRL